MILTEILLLIILILIAYNFVFCCVFEKLDAKKFKKENEKHLAGQKEMGGGTAHEQKSGSKIKSLIYDVLVHYRIWINEAINTDCLEVS